MRLRELMRPGVLLRVAIAVAAAIAIWFVVGAVIADRPTLVVTGLGARPIELLDPRWLRLVAVVPFFFLVRVWSLTDLSLSQQVLQASLRSLAVAAAAFALARPTWVTRESRVATVVLVDVSDSESEQQLALARGYVDELTAAAGGDRWLGVVTFAEKPQVQRKVDGKYAIGRHTSGPTRGQAGTDIQSAMQLAYGLFPPGHLPRLIVVSDGNQTAGDLASEAYRAKELGVKVSWRTFDQDPTREIRVVGLKVPDDLKVGQPYEVTAEVWSTHAESVTLALRQDEFPNPLEPKKTVELREGVNRIVFKSEAKRAGATS